MMKMFTGKKDNNGVLQMRNLFLFFNPFLFSSSKKTCQQTGYKMIAFKACVSQMQNLDNDWNFDIIGYKNLMQ